jgi:hypothetical protein
MCSAPSPVRDTHLGHLSLSLCVCVSLGPTARRRTCVAGVDDLDYRKFLREEARMQFKNHKGEPDLVRGQQPLLFRCPAFFGSPQRCWGCVFSAGGEAAPHQGPPAAQQSPPHDGDARRGAAEAPRVAGIDRLAPSVAATQRAGAVKKHHPGLNADARRAAAPAACSGARPAGSPWQP